MPVTATAAGLLAVVFTIAAAGKARPGAYGRFRRGTAALWPGPGRLPARPAAIIAGVVLAAEVSVAGGLAWWLVGLAAGGGPDPGVALAFGAAAPLLGAFTVAQVVALRRGNTASCACFGRRDTPVTRTAVARNLILIVVALVGAGTAYAADRPGTTGLSLVCAVAGGVAALILVSLEDIVSLFEAPAVPAKSRAAGR